MKAHSTTLFTLVVLHLLLLLVHGVPVRGKKDAPSISVTSVDIGPETGSVTTTSTPSFYSYYAPSPVRTIPYGYPWWSFPHYPYTMPFYGLSTSTVSCSPSATVSFHPGCAAAPVIPPQHVYHPYYYYHHPVHPYYRYYYGYGPLHPMSFLQSQVTGFPEHPADLADTNVDEMEITPDHQEPNPWVMDESVATRNEEGFDTFPGGGMFQGLPETIPGYQESMGYEAPELKEETCMDHRYTEEEYAVDGDSKDQDYTPYNSVEDTPCDGAPFEGSTASVMTSSEFANEDSDQTFCEAKPSLWWNEDDVDPYG